MLDGVHCYVEKFTGNRGCWFWKGWSFRHRFGNDFAEKKWDFSKYLREVRIRITLISEKEFLGRKESKHKVSEQPVWHVWEMGKVTGWMEWLRERLRKEDQRGPGDFILKSFVRPCKDVRVCYEMKAIEGCSTLESHHQT